MLVVVVETICAPVSLSTMCTLVPLTVEPDAGCTTVTTAGDDGRGPAAVGAGLPSGALAGAELPAPPEHPASRSATAAATKTRFVRVVMIAPASRGGRGA